MGDGRIWTRIGAISGLLAVGLGAFGAHGLKARLTAMGTSANFDTASQYQMYHALALVFVGVLAGQGRSGGALQVAGWMFLVGSLIFSGSLYALALSGEGWLGAITPIGGLSLMGGWLALAFAGVRS